MSPGRSRASAAPAQAPLAPADGGRAELAARTGAADGAPAARRKRHHLGFVLFAAVVVGMLVLGLVTLNAFVAQSSFRIDHLQARVDEQSQRYLALERQAAHLSAPGRIAAWAGRHEMRTPDEISVLQVEKRIRSRVKRQMEKTQREYYLNEQMKAIQKELGEGEDGRDEVAEIEERVKKTKLSKEAREKAQAEVKKLRTMSPMSAEATVVRNYLDWILSIPWNKPTKIKRDIKLAQKILNEDHYGLEKVKERILEYLAVQQRQKRIKGPILCLVGPPGVGKTSLGKSIAKATGRNFVRISLGGVRDEAEVRGHRRTYIGSMPGKVIQAMKKAKSSNPLFLLDEVDKLGADWRGDGVV